MSEVAAPVAPVAEPAPAVTEAAATETTAEEVCRENPILQRRCKDANLP